eukprot:CAMPEP_0185763040 /NCGR_PEP_ID=MMETSP1174-20130828/21992_1 /TAXON_ID=35687 /ORGANISM="Dictyocha speculum, Strain CCMP1381" /LENGTH=427 /DNA_ID=CAMNT_0028444973 /DNA_START=19 /DNA_END=1302 /DNA_ORIENTATION=+
MALLEAVPCCGHDILYGVFAGYVHFVFPRKHPANQAELNMWPIEDRAKFLLLIGYKGRAFAQLLIDRGYTNDFHAQGGDVDSDLATLLNEMKLLTAGTKFADNKKRFENMRRLAACATKTRLPEYKGNTSVPLGDCVNRLTRKVEETGSHSLTILRHPFPRAISSFFYKGHNPNHEAFNLRPGEWFNPETRPHGNKRKFSFREYADAPEYQNTLTKMFGDSRGCEVAQRCDQKADEEERRHLEARTTTGCLLQAGACHAYRNASLSVQNLHSAIGNINSFRFFGIQEAYNTSVLLLGATFDELEITEADFEADRVSDMKTKACSGYIRRELSRDPVACLRVMKANWLDVQLYEAAHKIFCERLKSHGLLSHPVFLRERERSTPWLCTSFDASSPEQYCGLLNTPKVEELRQMDKDGCKKFRSLKPVW